MNHLSKPKKSIDYYTLKANRLGLRSRAWFKLDEIQKADNILKPGMSVVEFGSSSGGWSEYALDKIGRQGSIIACDTLPMHSLKEVYYIQGNCFDNVTLEKLFIKTKGSKADVVLSDMSPNITGIPSIDIPNTIELIGVALKICITILKPGGSLIVKAFQGKELTRTYNKLRTMFNKINIRKPKASHICSREVYIVSKEKLL